VIRVRDTFKNYEAYKKFYTESKGYDLDIDKITDSDKAGIPEMYRWEWGLKELKEIDCKRVLDVGSWTGRFPLILAMNGFDVLALEANVAAYKYMKPQKYMKVNKMFEEFGGGKFDCITAFEVIEHAYDMERFIKQVELHLNDDGYFLFSTPNQDGVYGDDDNEIHLWTATLASLMETFKDWEIIDYEVGDLLLMIVRKK